MAPRFKVSVLPITKVLKNITIISIVLLSFFLILFSKSDLFLINSIKNISINIINPVTSIISTPTKLISNLVNEYKQFRSLKFENKMLYEEIKMANIGNTEFKRKQGTKKIVASN